jgi:hypothetical protein
MLLYPDSSLILDISAAYFTSMVTLKARQLKLSEVHTLLGYEPKLDGRFQDYLQLSSLDEQELTSLTDIRTNFFRYLNRAKISEGQAREISVSPLLQLAGYHQPPIYLEIEEDIDRIYIEDQNTYIIGRLDVVAVRQEPAACPLWILVVESKNTEASEIVGLAQMLAYAYSSLERQSSVWGLVTNGLNYRFFYIDNLYTSSMAEQHLTYQYMPSLNLIDVESAASLLQVLKAIREWEPSFVK